MNQIGVKICGVTNPADAQACADLGADFIGLNFFPKSPRYIKVETARCIVQAVPRNLAVGVFVDATATHIRRVAHEIGLTVVQLHGNVTAETCSELAAEFRVIRALSTHTRFKPEEAISFRNCDLLIDAHDSQQRGGTGELCDWSAARGAACYTRFLILAGGLNAQNVADAIAVVSPHAVDVCSGVEKKAGLKDHAAVAAFVAAVRNATGIAISPPANV